MFGECEMIIWVCGTVGLWDSENEQKEGEQKDNSGGTRKFGQDQPDGPEEWGQKRDDHLGLWDCGTVGLWDCGTLAGV